MTTETEIIRRAAAITLIATASPETRPYVAQFPLLMAGMEAASGVPATDRERLIFMRMCDELDKARHRHERARARNSSLPDIPVFDAEGRIPEALWALAAEGIEAGVRECEEAWAGIEVCRARSAARARRRTPGRRAAASRIGRSSRAARRTA